MIVVKAGGETIDLGAVEASPTIGITDYSRRETDDFGVTTIVKRGYARHMSVRLAVAYDEVDDLQRRLADLRATPAQWIADDRFAWLNVEGFYKDFQLDLAVPPLSYCTLTIEGLAEIAPVADPGGDPAPTGDSSTLLLLNPVDVTSAMIVSTNVPEADYPAWAAGTTYGLGARVIKTATHRIYESAAIGNIGNDPAGASGLWIDVGPTNRWAMFDQALGTATTRADGISITLAPGAIEALALLDVVGTSVRVQAPGGYDRTIAVEARSITFLDLPGVAGSVIVTVAGAGTVSVGTLLVGHIAELGITEESPTAGITDFSRKDVDDFGEVTVVQRAWAKRMSTRALIRTDAIDLVADRIAAVRARPVLWIGDADKDSLTIYGFFKDFSIEVSETVSKVSLSIEGLSKAAAIVTPQPRGNYAAGATYVVGDTVVWAVADGGDGQGYVRTGIGNTTGISPADATKWVVYVERGADGSDGMDGTDGVNGAPGANGQASYVHFAYADSADGTTNFTTGAGGSRTYIGVYSDFTAADSANPALYTWSLIKGADGANGTPGAPGANGAPSYVHIAYAGNATGTSNFHLSDPTGRSYIGIYTDSTLADSTNPALYTWSLIKGADGLDGTDGLNGAPGANGQASYVHFAYADSADGTTNFTTGAGGSRTYIGVYSDFTAADSANPALYTWSLIKGADGANGTPGAPGANGAPSYVHIAYAGNATGTSNFHLSDPTGRTYVGIYTDSTLADSTNPALYTWSLIKGADGAQGPTGDTGTNSAQVRLYKRSVAAPALPSAESTYTFASGAIAGLTNGWTVTVPAVDGNQLWTTVATAAANTPTASIAAASWAPTTTVVGKIGSIDTLDIGGPLVVGAITLTDGRVTGKLPPAKADDGLVNINIGVVSGAITGIGAGAGTSVGNSRIVLNPDGTASYQQANGTWVNVGALTFETLGGKAIGRKDTLSMRDPLVTDLQAAQSWQRVAYGANAISGSKTYKTAFEGWTNRTVGAVLASSGYMQFRFGKNIVDGDRCIVGLGYDPNKTGSGYGDITGFYNVAAGSTRTYSLGILDGASLPAWSPSDVFSIFWTDNSIRLYMNNTLVRTVDATSYGEMVPAFSGYDVGAQAIDMRCGPYDPRVEASVIGMAANGKLVANINDLDLIAESPSRKHAGETGATVGASWGGNLSGRPTELIDGRVAAGLEAGTGVVKLPVPIAKIPAEAVNANNYVDGNGFYRINGVSTGIRIGNANITVDDALSSNLLRRVGSGTFIGELDAEKTAGKDLSVLVGRTADKLTYPGSGALVSAKEPAEAGAEATTGKSLSLLVDRNLDNIADSASYARVLSGEVSGGVPKLQIAGSGKRLADQRNLPPITALNLGYKFTGALSYTSTTTSATISVTAGSALIGSNPISYNAMSTTVSGTAGTIVTYFLYVNETANSSNWGGSKTLFATTNGQAIYSDDNRVYIGAISVTFPSSGTGGGGGDPGGGLCVDEMSFLDPATIARDVMPGDLIECTSCEMSALRTINEPVEANRSGYEPSVRLITESGARVVVSCCTPMTLRDLTDAPASDMLGREVLVRRDRSLGWEPVVAVVNAGVRRVAKITVGNRMFFAGETRDARIATHNIVNKP